MMPILDIFGGCLTNNDQSCRWLLETLYDPDNVWARHMLLICPVEDVRNAFAAIVVHAIFCQRQYEAPHYLETDPSSDSEMLVTISYLTLSVRS